MGELDLEPDAVGAARIPGLIEQRFGLFRVILILTLDLFRPLFIWPSPMLSEICELREVEFFIVSQPVPVFHDP